MLYYNIDWIKKDSISEDTPYFYAQYKQEYPVEQGKDYVILETEGKGHYVGTVMAVRTRSPAWFGEGDEKIYIDGEKKPSIWGTGTEDYFLSAWGLKNDEHALLRHVLFRSMGNRRRPHRGLSLAHQRSDRVQQEHQGHDRAFRLDVARRKSEIREEQLERAAGRLFERGVLVSDRHADLHRPRAARPRAQRCPVFERVNVLAKDFRTTSITGRARRRRNCSATLYPQPQLLYQPEKAENGWVEIPFEVKKKEPLRLVLNCTRAPDYGRYQAYHRRREDRPADRSLQRQGR